MRIVPENPVAETAYDDARSVVGQFADCTALADVDGVVLRRVHRDRYAAVLEYHLPELAGGDILLVLGYELWCASHLLGGPVYELAAVAGATQTAGHFLAHLIATAAVCTGDGNHAVRRPEGCLLSLSGSPGRTLGPGNEYTVQPPDPGREHPHHKAHIEH